MAKVIPIGQPANESERQAIGFLRDHLPDGWLIFHNFEMRQGEEVFEIDIAILAPHAVYLVDVKGTRGNIDVYGSKWYPEGRQPFFSPLAKLRSHAKTMATIIRESNTGLIELRKAHVHAAVLLTADDVDSFGHGWRRVEFPAVCSAAGRTRTSGLLGKGTMLAAQPRTEIVWINPKAYAAVRPNLTDDISPRSPMMTLFDWSDTAATQDIGGNYDNDQSS